jgi:hypothetical protein
MLLPLQPEISFGVSDVLSSPLEFLLGVPQAPVLGTPLFSMFVSDLSDAIAHSVYFFADIKISQDIKSHKDCNQALTLHKVGAVLTV